MLGVGPDGKTHKGEGRRNEDYYAFGRKVLSPGDGVVTATNLLTGGGSSSNNQIICLSTDGITNSGVPFSTGASTASSAASQGSTSPPARTRRPPPS